MRFLKISVRAALAAAALLGFTAGARAVESFHLNFDGPGSTADDFAPAGLSIGYGQFVPFLDGDGDAIAGSEHWQIDPTWGAVPVIDPSLVGWGAAPSGSKALDARDGPVLFVFDVPFNLTYFSAVLDQSSLGEFSGADVLFFDVNNVLLGSIGGNQSTPGFLFEGVNLGMVKTMLLPPTAFYDNIAAVPEASTLWWAASLGAAMLLRRPRARVA
jgi:hypothetical protein